MSEIITPPLDPVAARETFEIAFGKAYSAFFAKRKAKDFRDLSPRFWVAWMDLEEALQRKVDHEELKVEFTKANKQFGAPGDFGYGTPPGESLKHLYWAWNDLVKAMAAPAA